MFQDRIMQTFIDKFWNDEAGFIVSAELILISTIATLAIVVGLAEVSLAVNQELGDVAGAFGYVNQGFRYQGLTGNNGLSNGANSNGGNGGSDLCDTSAGNSISSTAPTAEGA
jgi:hypothetical protein